MADAAGDRFTIRIGGDASGPVVAGHDNHVSVNQAPPGASTPGAPADEPPGSTQTNLAQDHANVFTVMHGEQHIHHHYDDGNKQG